MGFPGLAAAADCGHDTGIGFVMMTGLHGETQLELPGELKPGLTGMAEIVVGTRDTAPHVGSGKIGVLATPIMVNLMEAAALAAVERFMPPGFQTVGTHLDVKHFAATPVGLKVSARAELVKVEGRVLTFRIEASDEREKIGEGVHERLIINVERFDVRMQKKLGRA